MAATDIPLPDDAQDSCTSQSDATWNPHDQGSRGYGGPAARESSRCQTSRLVLLDYRSPVTHGFELDDRLQWVQRGTAVVLATGFAAEATGRAATRSDFEQVITHGGRSRPPDSADRGGGPEGSAPVAADEQKTRSPASHGRDAGLVAFCPREPGSQERPVQELGVIAREHGPRTSRKCADSVACAEGPPSWRQRQRVLG
jgi:hypothetical protein